MKHSIERMMSVAKATDLACSRIEGATDEDLDAGIDSAMDALREGKSGAYAIEIGRSTVASRIHQRRLAQAHFDKGVVRSGNVIYLSHWGRQYEKGERHGRQD